MGAVGKPYGAERKLPEPRSSRQIYDLRSITGLNKLPILRVVDNVMLGARWRGDAPPVELPELAEHIAIDGTFAFYTGLPEVRMRPIEYYQRQDASQPSTAMPPQGVLDESLTGRFVEPILVNDPRVPLRRRRFAQDLGAGYLRVFVMLADRWQVTDYEAYGDKNQKIVVSYSMPLSAMYYKYNRYGPLYDAQYMYLELERVQQSIKTQLSGIANKTIIYGHTMDLEQAKDDINNPDMTVVTVPNAEGVSRVSDTAVIDQLLAVKKELRSDYFATMRVVDLSETPQRPSGSDRALQLIPQTSYVEDIRDLIKAAIREAFGDSYTVEFTRLHVSTAVERQGELQLTSDIEKYLATGHLPEYERKARELL